MAEGAFVAGISVVQDRESGFLKEILVAPLSRTGIVLGKALGVAAIALAVWLVTGPDATRVPTYWSLVVLASAGGVPGGTLKPVDSSSLSFAFR